MKSLPMNLESNQKFKIAFDVKVEEGEFALEELQGRGGADYLMVASAVSDGETFKANFSYTNMDWEDRFKLWVSLTKSLFGQVVQFEVPRHAKIIQAVHKLITTDYKKEGQYESTR